MGKSVLIVDDEPRLTVALKKRLEVAGYEVFHALNGLAGVEAAALHEPDAVILDIRMPDITGYDACQRIHRLPGLKNVPVLFLSANVQYEAKQKAMESGGAAFLSKPYEASDILSTLEEMLEPAA